MVRQVAFAVVAGLGLAACSQVNPPADVLDCEAVEGVLACSTFEADDPPWTPVVDRGVIVLDDVEPSGGRKSLHPTVAVGGGKAAWARSLAPVDHYYARFQLRVPTAADGTGLAVLHLGEAVAPFDGTNVEIAGGNLGVGVATAGVFAYPAPVPRDRWVCVELELEVSDTAGHVIVRADGAPVVDRAGIDTLPAGGFGDVEVGLSYVAPEAASGTTVLIDDLAIASQPLAPCSTMP